MSDQPVETQPSEPQIGQVTSKIPTTKPKNPKRVAARKDNAKKTKQAREAQKKALVGAAAIIANNKAQAPHVPGPNAAVEDTKKVLTTTQWLTVVSTLVSMLGIYYKREEIKRFLGKKTSQTPPPSPEMQRPPPQSKKASAVWRIEKIS